MHTLNLGHGRWVGNCTLLKSHMQYSNTFSSARTMYALYFLTCTSVSLINIQCDIFLFVPVPPLPPPLPRLSSSLLPVLDDCTSRLPVGRRRRRKNPMNVWWVTPTPRLLFIWFLILSFCLLLSFVFAFLWIMSFFFACSFHTLPVSCYTFFLFSSFFTPLSLSSLSLLLITPL